MNLVACSYEIGRNMIMIEARIPNRDLFFVHVVPASPTRPYNPQSESRMPSLLASHLGAMAQDTHFRYNSGGNSNG